MSTISVEHKDYWAPWRKKTPNEMVVGENKKSWAEWLLNTLAAQRTDKWTRWQFSEIVNILSW